MKIDFETFATQILEMACVANTDGRFLWLSDRWTEALGWSKEKLLATPFLEFVHPDDVEPTLAEVEKLSEGLPTIRFENRYRTADGRWRWLEWTSSPRDGLLYSIARDITEIREVRVTNERRLRLLEMGMEISKAGYWVVELENDIVSWSKEVYTIHGLDPEDHVPTLSNGIDAYHPEDRAHVQRAINDAIEERKPFWFELRLLRPDGEERKVVSLGRPELDFRGDVKRIFGVFRDITDDPAHRRQEELEQFAYVASHDLRQPARTIHSFLELLGEELELSGEQEKYWSFVSGASERLLGMVDDLLLYANAGQRFELNAVDLKPIVRDVVADLEFAIAGRGATVEVGEMPSVMGNENPLRQVFQNLIGNAVKFGRDEGCVVRVSSVAHGANIHVLVDDNGKGIDPKYAERVFAPFQRLDADKPGSGIGLTIAQRIVQQCGGRIKLERSDSGGARFTVVLSAATT